MGGGFIKLKESKLFIFIVLSDSIVFVKLVFWILGIVVGSILFLYVCFVYSW